MQNEIPQSNTINLLNDITMKKNYVTCINRIVATLFLIFVSSSHAQDIHFTFDNAHNSNDGSFDYYEVDVMIQTINTTGTFKLGKGLLYFTYNTVAFGTNINANSAFEVTYPNPDYILGQYVDAAAASIYGVPTPNDNDSNRVAFAYSQTFSSSTFAADNVNDTPSKLFHIKIRYVDVNSDPMFCFDGGSAYDDQFETACGSSTAGPFDAADCGGYPGTVLVNDTFDCSGATLSNEDFKLLTGLSNLH